MDIIEEIFDDYLITTDTAKLDIAAIHDYLSNHSGWSNHISLAKMKKSIENSLNFGLFHQGKQIGFARVISDFATVAYLGDVYILAPYQGKGLSKKLMDVVMAHPELQGLRRWILRTSTADWLYEKYGFSKVTNPEIFMEKHDPYFYLHS